MEIDEVFTPRLFARNFNHSENSSGHWLPGQRNPLSLTPVLSQIVTMSSLAGALGPHGIHSPIKSEPGDVKHRIKDETKSEEDEEEMDDLFGNDAALEVDAPAE